MLTLKVITENPDEVIRRLAKKHFDAKEIIGKIIELDKTRRTTQSVLDENLATLNNLSKTIGALMKEGKKEEAEQARAKVAEMKEGNKELDAAKTAAEQEMNNLLVLVPNLPHDSVPEGRVAEDNLCEKSGGVVPQLHEGAVPHWDLCKKYDLIDFELGVKITGAGFPVYKGYGCRLQRALINFFLDNAREAGYLEIQPPYVVNADSGYGTGQLPDKEGQKRLVIVGGGFGGLKLARKLKSNKFQIVLLDKNNHHIFQPLLYQVATAGIEPSAISFPYRKIFKKREHFHIRICEAQQVFPEHNLLETSIGTLAYDYLVIATGCNTNYFGNDGLEKQTMALKNTSEALFNRNQILDSFEQAQNTGNKEERRRLMTFAIVGGGATGIELAGALAEMRKFVLPQDYPDLNINEMRIILLDGSSRLLSAFSEESSKEVADYLKKRDVEIKLNQRVMGYENYQLALNDGTAIDTKNVFWVAGVKANSLQGLPADAYGPGNRLKVDTYNRLSQYPNIFAIGDTALMISEEYPKGHPQVVQPAIQQARNLIRNLQRAETGLPLQPFIYQNKGSMATIGRNHAVVELKKLRFGGFPAWAVWLFIHLMSIVGVKNRLFIFVDWMWSYFTYDPSLRIIIKPLKRE